MRIIAEGPLEDSIRRMACFGLSLVRLDIRQSSDRHAEVMQELVEFYGIWVTTTAGMSRNVRTSCCERAAAVGR